MMIQITPHMRIRGLAICAIVATLHGGRIEACNDGGARFEMSLPLPARPTGADWA